MGGWVTAEGKADAKAEGMRLLLTFTLQEGPPPPAGSAVGAREKTFSEDASNSSPGRVQVYCPPPRGADSSQQPPPAEAAGGGGGAALSTSSSSTAPAGTASASAKQQP